MQAALALHAQDERGRAAYDLWAAALTGLAGRRDVHGLLAGRVVRVLTDTGAMPREEAARRFAAHLSIGIPAADQAAWAEGFLSGSGLLLVHDRDLLAVLDGWVAALPDQDFMDVLPLLRRTFGGFTAPERANIAAAVRQLADGAPARAAADEAVDADRAAGALRTVAAILGGAHDRAGRGPAWTGERGSLRPSDEAVRAEGARRRPCRAGEAGGERGREGRATERGGKTAQ